MIRCPGSTQIVNLQVQNFINKKRSDSLAALKMRQILCLLFLIFVDCYKADLSVDEQWAGFKTRYGKNYRSWEEETYRRKIWEEELQFIAEHNYEEQVTHTLGLVGHTK